jgi:hypothetical protein
MRSYRVLVIGGYGFFGSRLVERLSLNSHLHLLVAGRSIAMAQSLVGRLQPTAQAAMQAVAVDAMSPNLGQALAALAPDAVVHTSGPFQGQDYRVAQACIAQGAHYIDLADGRQFVAGIAELDAEARGAGVLVTSGASSVPALSSAAVDHLSKDMSSVQDIDIGISPGNRTERGLSTVQAILSYCGQPLPGGSGVHGWSGAWRHQYSNPVGRRLLSPCDVPDLSLLPARYEGEPRVRFGAGLELAWLHHTMNLMAALTRLGVVKDWSVHARALKRLGDLFKHWGSDAGAMHVSVSGKAADGAACTRQWALVATDGDGPFVPTLAAAALVRKLAAGQALPAGAQPCMGLLSLDDFTAEAQGLSIFTRASP